MCHGIGRSSFASMTHVYHLALYEYHIIIIIVIINIIIIFIIVIVIFIMIIIFPNFNGAFTKPLLKLGNG